MTRLFRALLIVALAFAPATDRAQTPSPALDAQRYPQLAAMKAWLENGTSQARHCAVSAGLFAEANDFYRATRSEPQTLEELTRRHAGQLSARDQQQLKETLTHVTGMAAGFAELDAETAPIAYSQLCIGRAKNPKTELSAAAIKTRFDAALRCQRADAAGSLERKECVASAFRL